MILTEAHGKVKKRGIREPKIRLDISVVKEPVLDSSECLASDFPKWVNQKYSEVIVVEQIYFPHHTAKQGVTSIVTCELLNLEAVVISS